MNHSPHTQGEVVEGNRLIMFFDGAENIEIDIMGKPAKAIKYKDQYYPEDRLPGFEEDWNLLMPVVEKIEATHTEFDGYFGVHISSNGCSIVSTRLNTSRTNPHYSYFNDVTHETKLSSTWYAVIQFIKWYNSQTPKP